ncbi:N-acetylglucosamine kinase [Ornithinibacillus halophilus]|uniref:BadF-type ATPase n=1 Tax=Ornithinibacillus halophilus TaxID=930117 RepID=A0A1M5K1P4_9BACI|nr:BadF/BadG/BcrA/BcrD ATPase family protein [Ornithinibacillus halophilus]SHG46762.1 BadF-type ATPase [Ornithinibacillus halophilus]
MYVLGIDGGGTKTKGVIASSTGEIAAEATVGPSNPNSVSKEQLENEFTLLFNELMQKSGELFSEVKHIYAGMSGVEHPVTKSEMSQLITNIIPGQNVTITNDAITALYSGTLGKPGIVQIAGTGSITYGLNEEGKFGRVGGWGYLLGERGSGYALGSDALKAVFATHDGLGEDTLLLHSILKKFETSELPNIVKLIYQSKNSKELIASISKLVFEAYDQGDSVASSIIRNNAQNIGDSIACLIKRMFNQKLTIPVVLVGGVFKRIDVLEPLIMNSVQGHEVSINLISPNIEPVGGAVIAGLKEEGLEIGEEFITNFHS